MEDSPQNVVGNLCKQCSDLCPTPPGHEFEYNDSFIIDSNSFISRLEFRKNLINLGLVWPVKRMRRMACGLDGRGQPMVSSTKHKTK